MSRSILQLPFFFFSHFPKRPHLSSESGQLDHCSVSHALASLWAPPCLHKTILKILIYRGTSIKIVRLQTRFTQMAHQLVPGGFKRKSTAFPGAPKRNQRQHCLSKNWALPTISQDEPKGRHEVSGDRFKIIPMT